MWIPVLTVAPITGIEYFMSGKAKGLTELFTVRSDLILGAYSNDNIVRTLFNDYVSCYSPIGSDVLDQYLVCSDKMLREFIVDGDS